MLIMKTWCVKNVDGWCATATGRPFKEAACNVRTRCKFFISLPWGCEEREPTCPECLAALRKTKKRKAVSKT